MTRGLGIIHMALSGLLIGLFCAVSLVWWRAAEPGDGTDIAVMVAIYGALALTVLVPGFVGGLGLVLGKPWGRGVIMVLSGILLFGFPFGTMLGGYGLWVLFTDTPDPPIPLGVQEPGSRSNVPSSS